jgi:hypothetical protein
VCRKKTVVRVTARTCSDKCRRILGKRWRAAHRKEVQARNARYYAANRKTIQARHKRNYAANPKKYRAMTKRWKVNNRKYYLEENRAYAARYRAARRSLASK